jgi:hypothetical protein
MFAPLNPLARAALRAAGTLLALFLLAACAQPPSATPPPAAASTQPAQPEVTTNPAGPASPSPAATAATTLPAETQIPPRTDRETPTPVQSARLSLAARLGLKPNEISVVSEGAWTTDPIACVLDLPGTGADRLIQGEHKQVILSAKNKQYEYWVFGSAGGLALALPCG